MTKRSFPSDIPASSRVYNPGFYPQTVFEAQNGATQVIRYGNRRVNSSLTLGFTALTDAQVVQILKHYENVNSDWDHVGFGINYDASSGIDDDALKEYVRENSSGLKWRYTGPPEVVSIFKGRHNVTCEFTGFLDG